MHKVTFIADHFIQIFALRKIKYINNKFLLAKLPSIGCFKFLQPRPFFCLLGFNPNPLNNSWTWGERFGLIRLPFILSVLSYFQNKVTHTQSLWHCRLCACGENVGSWKGKTTNNCVYVCAHPPQISCVCVWESFVVWAFVRIEFDSHLDLELQLGCVCLCVDVGSVW